MFSKLTDKPTEVKESNDLDQIKAMIVDLREGIERLVKGQIVIITLISDIEKVEEDD